MEPAELRAREQWVAWKKVKRAGKFTKVPVQARNPGRNASVTDPRTWATYEEAKEAAKQPGIAGIGFVFTDDDPFCGVDFDDAMEDGKINAEVLHQIEQLSTYTERSPSGKGFHCIGRGEVKGERHKANGIEVYDRGRFFCMTGKRLRGTPVKLKQINVDWLLSENGNGHSKRERESQDGQPRSGKRHPHLVALAARLRADDTPRDVAEEMLRAEAAQIGLPQREQDEVGRIVEWAYQGTNLDNRIKRDAEQRMVKHQGNLRFQEELLGAQDVGEGVYQIADELELADEKTSYVIDHLMPDGAVVLLSAERKSGKTRMALSVVRALVDGDPFLNYFDVDAPAGRVMYVNYELTRVQFRQWVRDIGLKRPERMMVKHAHTGNFHFWKQEVREEFAELCKQNDVWCLIIDTQLMAMIGYIKSENDNVDVAGWQQEVMKLKEACEVENVIIVHHIGKADKERGRGASQIEAWPSVLWYMEVEDNNDRSFRARGRIDADIGPLILGYDKETETYFWDGETKGEDRTARILVSWLQELIAIHEATGEWPLSTPAKQRMGVKTNRRTELLDSALAQGLVRRVSGEGQRVTIEVTAAGVEYASR